jgi:hypothetical protein
MLTGMRALSPPGPPPLRRRRAPASRYRLARCSLVFSKVPSQKAYFRRSPNIAHSLCNIYPRAAYPEVAVALSGSKDRFMIFGRTLGPNIAYARHGFKVLGF